METEVLDFKSIQKDKRASKEFIDKCRVSPEYFGLNVLGINRFWSKQREICEAIVKHDRVTVRSCNGIGKSFVVANIALWFLQCFPDSIVITTSGSWVQVEKITWAEIRNMFNRSKIPLMGELLQTQLKISDKWFAMGISPDKGERMQGFRSKHCLIIVDEASDLPDEIAESIEGLRSQGGVKVLLIGNPLKREGEFFRSFTTKADLYHRIKISAFDAPAFTLKEPNIPGLVSKEWVEEKRREWGVGTVLWKTRVLGDFPDEGEDSLFQQSDIENAEKLDLELTGFEPKVLGIDVARFGTNDTVFMHRTGNKVELVDGIIPAHQGKDIPYTLGRAIQFIDRFQPDAIIIDDIGIGGTLYDFVAKKYDNVYMFDSNDTEELENSIYFNIKSEIYHKLAAKFRDKCISIPKGTRLTSELPTVKIDYSVTNNKLMIKNKRKSSKGKEFDSPDFSDALMMTEYGLGMCRHFEVKKTRRIVHGVSVNQQSSASTDSRTGYG